MFSFLLSLQPVLAFDDPGGAQQEKPLPAYHESQQKPLVQEVPGRVFKIDPNAQKFDDNRGSATVQSGTTKFDFDDNEGIEDIQRTVGPPNRPAFDYGGMEVRKSFQGQSHSVGSQEVTVVHTYDMGNSVTLERTYAVQENSNYVKITDRYDNPTSTTRTFSNHEYENDTDIDSDCEWYYSGNPGQWHGTSYTKDFTSNIPASGYVLARNKDHPGSDPYEPHIFWVWKSKPSKLDFSYEDLDIHYDLTVPAKGQKTLVFYVGVATTDADAEAMASMLATGTSTPSRPGSSSVNVASADKSAFPRVDLTVSVKDNQGQPVSGLGVSDFTVTENNGSVANLQVVPVGTVQSNLAVSLVLDRSGSFSAEQPQLESAAKSFVNQLGQQDQAAVVNFGSNSKVDQVLTSDKTQINPAITNPNAGGLTALYDGIIDGLNEAANAQGASQAVIVITDGQKTSGSKSKSDAINRAQQLGIPVYTISYGSGTNTSVLTDLANQTNAKYFSAANTSDMQKIYQDLANLLNKQYKVSYDSLQQPCLSKKVTAKVEVGGQDDSIDYTTPCSDVTINQIKHSSSFPTIKAYVTVGKNSPVSGLGTSDVCSVNERGTSVSNFTFQPVGQQPGGSNAVNVAFALDRSGSFSSQQNTMEQAALDFVQSMQSMSGSKGALVNFGSGTNIKQPLTSDLFQLKIAIKGSPGVGSGSTYLWDGIYNSIQQLANNPGPNREAVVAITDGQNNGGQHKQQSVIDAAQKAGIPVFTIGFGSGVDKNKLQSVAQATGGAFYDGKTSAAITQIFGTIQNVINNQYLLEYTSPYKKPPQGPKDRLLELDLCQYGSDSKTYRVDPTRRIDLSLQGILGKPGDTVNIPVFLDTKNQQISSLTFTVDYNDNVVDFKQIANPQTGLQFTSSRSSGQVQIDLSSGTVQGNSQIAELRFDIDPSASKGDVSQLQIPSAQAKDNSQQTIQVNTSGDQILVNDPPKTCDLNLTNASGCPGGSVTVSLQIDTKGQTVGGITTQISYDSAKLTYQTTAASGIGGNETIQESQSSGEVTLNWQSPSINGSGPIADLTFQIDTSASPGTTPIDLASVQQLVDDQGRALRKRTSNGQVTINQNCGQADLVAKCISSTLTISVDTKNKTLGGFEIPISFDSSKLSFQSATPTGIGQGGFVQTGQTGSGQYTVGMIHSPGVSGKGDLLKITFQKTAPATVTIGSSAFATDLNGAIVSVNLSPASVMCSGGCPDGDVAPIVNGQFQPDGQVNVGDALVVLRIALGLVQADQTAMTRGDVAPLVNGQPSPDGTINVGDALVVLRKALGLVNFSCSNP